jgi:hypothetical protein
VRRPASRLPLGSGLLLIASLAACARHPPATEPLPDLPEAPTGYHALLQATWTTSGGKRRAQVGIAYLAPDSLRLEILTPGGTPRAVLVSTGEGSVLLDMARRTYRPFETGRRAVEALVSISAPPGLLGRLLLGPESLKKGFDCRPREKDSGTGAVTCRLEEGETIEFRGGDDLAAEFLPASGEAAQILWSAGPGGSRKPPSTVRVVQRNQAADLVVRLVDIRFADPLPALFTLAPPEGFSREERGDTPWTP